MIPTLQLSRVPEIELTGSDAEPARFAQTELRRYLEMILGPKSADGRQQVIHLSVDQRAGLTDEGYRWQVENQTLEITAGGNLGLVFGVYAFLREVCGCRFCGLGTEGEFVPRASELVLSVSHSLREPKLWYRAIQFYFFEHPSLYQRVIDWMAKNGFNYVLYHLGTEHDAVLMKEQRDPKTGAVLFPEGNGPSMFNEEYFNRHLLPEIRKRGLKLDFNHHNLCYWLPPGKYAPEHPEWYAEIDGQRAKQFNQLCICTTNHDAVAELVRRVTEFLRAHPVVSIVGIAPEDGHGLCQCAACRASDLDPQDAFRVGGEHRTASAENRSFARRYARLLNEVARAVRKEFPRVLVGGIAYVDSQWPPRDLALEDNITFTVAVYWRDAARPLASDSPSPVNRFFFDLIRQWRGELRSRLMLYEYYMGMMAQRCLPYPMTEVIAEDWENLAALGVEGASIQCLAGCHEAYSLNLLAFSRCAWGAPVDVDGLLDDYVLSVFGNAGESIRPIFRALLDAMAERRDDPDDLLPDGKNVAFFWKRLGSRFVWKCVEQARAAATDDRERNQVERLATYLRYCELAARAIENKQEIPAVIDYLERRKLPGWILPRAISRWKGDLT